MSSYRDLHIVRASGRSLPGGIVLRCGGAEILFTEDQMPLALYDGEVFFPDEKQTRRSAVLLHTFHPDSPHTRLPVHDFQFTIASALMRNLRPMLRRPQETPTDA